ncbi:MAG: hypothetical protein JWO67_3465 [Streptosporangiaceae bacterium]|nr:hypothetical protein [Streptosporangiaceae bacterium]
MDGRISAGRASPGKPHPTPGQPFVGARGHEQLIGPNVQPVWSPVATETWGQGMYDSISAKGFTAVRFVLFWDDFEPKPGAWNETAFTTLTAALDRAQAAGLYIILDCVHLYGRPEGQSRVPEWARAADGMAAVAANGLGFLQELATRYGRRDALAAYDPVNEPARLPLDHRSVLADYTKIVDAIRAKDRATTIMLEPTYGDAKVPADAFKSFTPADPGSLVWSVHDYYVGGEGDGYGPHGEGDSASAADGTTGYNPAHRADLAAHLRAQLHTAARAGMALWIGEFGIGAEARGHDAFIRDKVALFKAHGVGYAWWEYYARDGVFSMLADNGAWHPWVHLLR